MTDTNFNPTHEEVDFAVKQMCTDAMYIAVAESVAFLANKYRFDVVEAYQLLNQQYDRIASANKSVANDQVPNLPMYNVQAPNVHASYVHASYVPVQKVVPNVQTSYVPVQKEVVPNASLHYQKFKKSKSSKSSKRTYSLNKVKRNKTGFLLYSDEVRREIYASFNPEFGENSKLTPQEIVKIIAVRWIHEDQAIRDLWNAKAEGLWCDELLNEL